MADHHIVRRDDGNPEIRLFASPGSPQTYVEVSSGSLAVALHLTRYQVAELITSLQAVDNELAAREVEQVPA
jgi:hypothetical protein